MTTLSILKLLEWKRKGNQQWHTSKKHRTQTWIEKDQSLGGFIKITVLLILTIIDSD